MDEHRGEATDGYDRSFSTWSGKRGLEDYSVCSTPIFPSCILNPFFRALSEVIATPLPYDNVLELRDRLWEISPTLVRYDVTEPTSVDVALAGLKTVADKTADAKATDAPLRKPISNFYQTDPISRA